MLDNITHDLKNINVDNMNTMRLTDKDVFS